MTELFTKIYGNPAEWEHLGPDIPVGVYDSLDPVAEGMGAQAYVYLAQLLEVLLGYSDAPERISESEITMSTHILQFTLIWMDYCGYRRRHPDLDVIPNKVAPTEFVGGPEHTADWIRGQLALCIQGEEARDQGRLN